MKKLLVVCGIVTLVALVLQAAPVIRTVAMPAAGVTASITNTTRKAQTLTGMYGYAVTDTSTITTAAVARTTIYTAGGTKATNDVPVLVGYAANQNMIAQPTYGIPVLPNDILVLSRVANAATASVFVVQVVLED